MEEQLTKTQYHIDFTEEQYKEVEELAGLNYLVKQIAMYFDVNAALLQKEFDKEDSRFNYHVKRGKLFSRTLVERKNLNSAKDGNTTSIQIFRKMAEENRLNQLKNELFGL